MRKMKKKRERETLSEENHDYPKRKYIDLKTSNQKILPRIILSFWPAMRSPPTRYVQTIPSGKQATKHT